MNANMDKMLNVNKSAIKQQLNDWDNRIIYKNVLAFKENGELAPLDKIYSRSNESFVIISLGREITVYKTIRYFIQNHSLLNNNIAFLDGRQISAFLDEGSEHWRLKQGINEFIDLFGHQFYNKWIVIPNMNRIKFDLNLAIYFINKLKTTEAIGLVFFDEEDGAKRDLGSVIATNQMFQKDFLEFPAKNRRIRVAQLEDDGL